MWQQVLDRLERRRLDRVDHDRRGEHGDTAGAEERRGVESRLIRSSISVGQFAKSVTVFASTESFLKKFSSTKSIDFTRKYTGRFSSGTMSTSNDPKCITVGSSKATP
jgi:hypothetical protein